ncbi:xanthine dehydrogenase accessory factor [Virgisporangium aliadipatigenens]|uniref:Xanthine dehydrogenase accessory factor n=1 Tax=Virgisporangium aliadipatigenens TaxID=741659 RepID=A0A8J3YLF3_9ACTN|nr:XdhC/CoxI family protein [Virgisporangium aliadipatigenens]GIJ46278.1 xanthine dehydrogenase accessory factor [Virgisporangium aliadipatigenens]
MRDVLDELVRWWEAGEPVGMATVVRTWRSAPRPAGATMLVGPDGSATGSVSAGCVEATVYELATRVQATGVPVRQGLEDFDDLLTCGGSLDVFVERVDRTTFPELGDVARDIRAGTPVAVATALDGDPPGRRLVVWADRTAGTLGSGRLDAAAAADARERLRTGDSGIAQTGAFVAAYAPPPRMIVFGAVDFAAALARVGAVLGYRVTVCDARPVFATARRFPQAHDVVVDWPHRYLRAEAGAGRLDGRTVVCVLTHDPRFDVPVLAEALRMPLAYVGAMGSRHTHDDRLARLREHGLTGAELERLASPIGLDLGARTPEETAVSIVAEIVASRYGGSGGRLRDVPGRIHRPPRAGRPHGRSA